MHQELDDVLDGNPPSFADLPRLGHLNRCLTEALRMTPPGWIFSRSVTSATELGGVQLPARTDVFWSPYLLHRLPDVFPAPDTYDPDRWLPERASSRQWKALLPFGHGSRKCIGDTFGMAEAALILAAIASHWRLVPDPHAPPARQTVSATMILRSLPVIALRRRPTFW
ncbi:cytochrome P450 [Streptomyces albireticuli]|uniref:cytochrome P450 n=1 Tax=Streptomyces albireticuli TaxID=1940 RepID=UPI003556408A